MCIYITSICNPSNLEYVDLNWSTLIKKNPNSIPFYNFNNFSFIDWICAPYVCHGLNKV